MLVASKVYKRRQDLSHIKNMPDDPSIKVVNQNGVQRVCVRKFFTDSETGRRIEKRTYIGKIIDNTFYTTEECAQFKVPVKRKARGKNYVKEHSLVFLGDSVLPVGGLYHSKLVDDLLAAYEDQDGLSLGIMALACYLCATDDGSFANFDEWAQDSAFKFFKKDALSDLPSFFNELGSRADLLDKLFALRKQRVDASTCVAVEFNDTAYEQSLKSGLNKEPLGLLAYVKLKSNEPIYFALHESNVSDLLAINKAIAKAQEWGCDDAIVLDSSFESAFKDVMASNISSDVLVDLDRANAWLKDKVKENYKELTSFASYLEIDCTYGMSFEPEFALDSKQNKGIGNHAQANIYYNGLKREDEQIALHRKLTAFKKEYLNTPKNKRDDSDPRRKFFDLSTEKGKEVLNYNHQVCEVQCQMMGVCAHLSNRKRKLEDSFIDYSCFDYIKNSFYLLKNKEDPLEVKQESEDVNSHVDATLELSHEGLMGMGIVYFVAAILKSDVENVFKKAVEDNNITVKKEYFIEESILHLSLDEFKEMLTSVRTYADSDGNVLAPDYSEEIKYVLKCMGYSSSMSKFVKLLNK